MEKSCICTATCCSRHFSFSLKAWRYLPNASHLPGTHIHTHTGVVHPHTPLLAVTHMLPRVYAVHSGTLPHLPSEAAPTHVHSSLLWLGGKQTFVLAGALQHCLSCLTWTLLAGCLRLTPSLVPSYAGSCLSVPSKRVGEGSLGKGGQGPAGLVLMGWSRPAGGGRLPLSHSWPLSVV